ncbi:MAG: nucleotidyltransferase domain-containing protein [Flavobacteriaceae bacterium]|jgi:predicted nucleotidyltransferase|nr:nucleotidyltransferase domain-containing protein [Flavobacteriaceae bacterium]
MNNLNINKEHLYTLCKKHNVENLYLFGSALTDRFSNESDVDILVKFLPTDLFQYFNNYISLKENLEKIFGRNVDLVEEQTLKNPVLIRTINRNKQQIYG